MGLEPSDEQRQPEAAQVQPFTRGGAFAREEDRVVDPRRHDADVLGIGSVEADQLGRLGGRGREDAVGAGDHALLPVQP